MPPLCICLRCGTSGLECDPDQICENCRTDIDREHTRFNSIAESGNCTACGKDEADQEHCWCQTQTSDTIDEAKKRRKTEQEYVQFRLGDAPVPPTGGASPGCLVSVSHNGDGYWVWRHCGTTLERLLPDGTWTAIHLEMNYPPTTPK